MIYIIVMFFILELIVFSTICIGLFIIDKKICKFSEKIKVNRHTLKFQLRAVYDVANNFKMYILRQKKVFLKRRREFIRNVLKGLMFATMFFFFKKTKLKKKFLFVEFLLVLYDTFRADCTA